MRIHETRKKKPEPGPFILRETYNENLLAKEDFSNYLQILLCKEGVKKVPRILTEQLFEDGVEKLVLSSTVEEIHLPYPYAKKIHLNPDNPYLYISGFFLRRIRDNKIICFIGSPISFSTYIQAHKEIAQDFVDGTFVMEDKQDISDTSHFEYLYIGEDVISFSYQDLSCFKRILLDPKSRKFTLDSYSSSFNLFSKAEGKVYLLQSMGFFPDFPLKTISHSAIKNLIFEPFETDCLTEGPFENVRSIESGNKFNLKISEKRYLCADPLKSRTYFQPFLIPKDMIHFEAELRNCPIILNESPLLHQIRFIPPKLVKLLLNENYDKEDYLSQAASFFSSHIEIIVGSLLSYDREKGDKDDSLLLEFLSSFPFSSQTYRKVYDYLQRWKKPALEMKSFLLNHMDNINLDLAESFEDTLDRNFIYEKDNEGTYHLLFVRDHADLVSLPLMDEKGKAVDISKLSFIKGTQVGKCYLPFDQFTSLLISVPHDESLDFNEVFFMDLNLQDYASFSGEDEHGNPLLISETEATYSFSKKEENAYETISIRGQVKVDYGLFGTTIRAFNCLPKGKVIHYRGNLFEGTLILSRGVYYVDSLELEL